LRKERPVIFVRSSIERNGKIDKAPENIPRKNLFLLSKLLSIYENI
jgi:hypothetical protein